jgi:hypothetical protein
MTIGFSESDDPAIARAAQKKKVRAIGARVVGGLDFLVFSNLIATPDRVPAVGIPAVEQGGIGVKSLPDFDQGPENVRRHSALGSERAQDCPAPKKRLEVSPELRWEVRDDLMGESLFVPDPFEELALEGLDGPLRPISKV